MVYHHEKLREEADLQAKREAESLRRQEAERRLWESEMKYLPAYSEALDKVFEAIEKKG
jgi:vacuolar-type H+-ATPase subunit E/Vma4